MFHVVLDRPKKDQAAKQGHICDTAAVQPQKGEDHFQIPLDFYLRNMAKTCSFFIMNLAIYSRYVY